MSAEVAFAFGAGLVATANPCGFAMLPSFLAFYLGANEGGSGPRSLAARARQGFVVGSVLSASFGAVFLAAGLLVAAGLRFFIDFVPWLAVVIAAGLVALGVAMLLGRHIGLTTASRVRVGGGKAVGYRRVAAFGVTYAVASLSCTLAVFLVVVSQAVAAANPLELLAVFGAYAAGSASVLIALSMSAALAKGGLARGLRRLLPAVNRVAGGLLLVAGAYLLLYWLPPVLSGGQASSGLASRISQTVSSTAASFLSANTGAFFAVFAVLVAAGAALVLLGGRRAAAAPADGSSDVDCCEPGTSAGEHGEPARELVTGRS